MGSNIPRLFDKICTFFSTKRAPEIAYQLLDILSIFGGPSILESDKEFVNSAIAKLINMGSGLKKVHEKPRYS